MAAVPKPPQTIPSPRRAWRVLRQGRSRVERAPVELAGGLGRLVWGAAEERLDGLMRTPARRVVLDGIFWRLPRLLEDGAGRAAKLSSSVRLRVTGRPDGGADMYHLEIVEGSSRMIRGESSIDPRLTITVDAAELVRLAAGSSDPVRAYLAGRLRVAGDPVFAARLASLVRSSRRVR